MCGFVVLVSNQPPEPRDLRDMLDSIRSRGPDDRSFAQEEWFALGFCRLSILILGEGGRQPVTSAAGDVLLVFNGEIYNFPSLKKQLRREDGITATSEAAALLQLYLKHGPSFAEQLDGDYAVVILDSRSRTCFAFRDPLGVKPLYYGTVDDSQTWILSSHIKAFFRHPDFSSTLDAVALIERRVLSFWSSDRTCFEGIHQLDPGHSLTIQVPRERDHAKIKHEIAPFSSLPPTDETGTGKIAVEQVDVECAHHIGEAIRKRVEHSNVDPIVLALSGGIDSSLMAALAGELRQRLTAVTIFDTEECCDQEYAAELSHEVGLTHRSYEVATSEFLEEFPKIVLEMAGPSPNFTPYFLGRAMKHFYPTAKVLLCGEGADEFFIGYPVMVNSDSFWSGCLQTMSGLSPETVAESPLLEQVRHCKSLHRNQAWLNLIDMFQRAQLVNLHLVPFDHGTMAHSVECRVPYLDSSVIRFIQSVPAHLRILGSTTKILLRILLAQTLGSDTTLAQHLLTRPSSPAFFSTLGCRNWFREFLRKELPGSKLARSELVSFALDGENLFWLASVATIFLRHRGRIDGMRFDDLADEVLSGSWSSSVDFGTPAWQEKKGVVRL